MTDEQFLASVNTFTSMESEDGRSVSPIRILVGDFYYEGKVVLSENPVGLVYVGDKNEDIDACVLMSAITVVEPSTPHKIK